MTEKILFVDDDPNILEAYQRQLRKKFVIETASGGESGIDIIKSRGPFAVVVSDMRMPGMNGVQFLAKVRELEPEIVRVMLTGQADMNDTINAVNEGHVFRFLTKPCPPITMIKALMASLEQYRLVIAEKELLEKTLTGSIKVLTELLSIMNPSAFGRASRIKHYVRHIAKQLQLPKAWRFEMAAMLSQIGCITLPPDILSKVYAGQRLSVEEQEMFSSHPSVGYSILSKIPRLESIAQMIKNQHKPYSKHHIALDESNDSKDIGLGAQMLKIVLDFDQLVLKKLSPKTALKKMRDSEDYDPLILKALDSIEVSKDNFEIRTVRVDELSTNMVVDEDIKSKDGLLLLTKGQEVTYSVVKCLQSIKRRTAIIEPIRVLIQN